MEYLVAYLIGIASSLSVEKGINRISFSRAYKNLSSELDNKAQFNQQRAVYRSLSIALLSLLNEVDERKLADLDLDEEGVHIPRQETRFQASVKLKNHLAKSIEQLQYMAISEQNINEQKYKKNIQRTVDSFHLDISESTAESMAGALLVTEDFAKVNEHYFDWHSIPGSALQTLPNAIVDMAISIGGWDEARSMEIKPHMLDNIFGNPSLWYKTFTMCFLNEIIVDEQLFKQITTLNLLRTATTINEINDAINTLEVELDSRLEQIQLAISAVQQTVIEKIDHWRRDFKFDKHKVFTPFVNSGTGAYSEMYFASEKDKFVGRESIIKLIESNFLTHIKQAPKFKWTTFTGEAGTGKSRLALELISRYKADWPIAGFVKADFVMKDKIDNVQPEQIWAPAIFVIDYATRFINQTLRFLERCEEMQHHLDYPIRVILIMRRPSEQLFKALEFHSDYGSVFNACFPVREFHDPQESGIVNLGLLGDTETLQLMRGRLDGQRQDISDSKLLDFLQSYDSRKRPLVAALIADALRNNALPDNTKTEDNETRRLSLFYDYLCRNYVNRWQYLGEQQSLGGLSKLGEQQIDKHISLTLLSTMVRGVTNTSLERLSTEMKDPFRKLLPNIPGLDVVHQEAVDLDEKVILATIVGAIRATPEDPYPSLEPDLVGESMVIHFMLENHSKMCPPSSGIRGRNRETLTEMAWRCNAEGAAYFASMLAQDFPEHAAKLNWLLPDNAKLIKPFSRSLLLRNVLADIIIEWRSQKVKKSTLARLGKLLDLMRYAKSQPTSARDNTAETLRQISQHLAKLINKNIFLPEKSLSRLWERADTDIRDNNFMLESISKNNVNLKSKAASSNLSSMSAFAEASPRSTLVGTQMDLETKFDSSDQELVKLAIELQLKIFKLACRKLWHESEYAIRSKLLEAVKWALASALWNDRHVKDKGGTAPYQLTKKEKKLRENLRVKCKQIISPENSYENIASASILISNLLYAGELFKHEELDNIQKVIQLKTSTDVVKQNTYATRSILGFFNNYFPMKIWAAETILKDVDDNATEVRQELFQILQLINTVFEQLHNNDLHIDVYRASVSNLCRCHQSMLLSSEIYTDEEKSQAAEQTWAFLIPYLSNCEQTNLAESELGLLYTLCKQLNRHQHPIFYEQLATLLESANFDGPSLSVRALTTRINFIKWLVFNYEDDFAPILEKFLSQIGTYAEKDVVKIVLDLIPAHGVTASQISSLLDVFISTEKHYQFEWRQQKRCIIHLWSQYLILDKIDLMTSCLATHWEGDVNAPNFIHQSLAFDGLLLLARWTSPTDKWILTFIPKIEAILQLPSFNAGTVLREIEPDTHAHHVHLIELLSDLVKLGLERAENIDVYLNLMERVHGK